MTDQTPRTEAGRLVTRKNARWLALLLSPSHDPKAQAEARALADEWFDGLAQARTEAEHDSARLQTLLEDMTQDYNALAQARAEALDAIEALPKTGIAILGGPDMVERSAVRAILAGETE